MRSRIRLASPADGPALASIYAPAVVARATSFELEPPSAEEMAARVAKTLARMPWLVCEREGAVLGYVYASPHRERAAYRWSVEVSVYVDGRIHRSGMGRALYTALFGVLALQGYRTALAGIALPHPASVGLHESLGFVLAGVYRGIGFKLGGWHDVGWWQRDLAPREASPAEPRALPEILGEEAFAQALADGERLLDEARIGGAVRAAGG